MNNDNGANNSSNQIESTPNATAHYCGSANEQKSFKNHQDHNWIR